MPLEKVTFTGHAGHTLSARLEQPKGPHLATALFAHCFACTKDSLAASRISRRLAAAGIAVLRFDFTGLGQSEWDFGATTLTTNLEDLKAAAAYLTQRDMAPSLLVGHSLGGSAVLTVAPDIPGIQAVATIGAPYDPAHVTRHFEPALPEIAATGSAEVVIGDSTLRIGKEFVESLDESRTRHAIEHLGAALLVLHAPKDEVVSIQNATQIFSRAKHPKSFVTLDSSDHLLSDQHDAEYAASMIAAWAARYLHLTPPAPPPGAPEGIIQVAEADPEGFLQDIQSGPNHHLLADEPKAYGGTDQGLSPYGFLSAGLGACTSMTLRMYARKRGVPLRHVEVAVNHDKVHAQDAGLPIGERIDSFTRVIRLFGVPDDLNIRNKLIEIADKCPAHKTLEGCAAINTEVEFID